MIFVKNVQKETLISLFLRYKLFRKKKAKCFEFNLIIFMRHILKMCLRFVLHGVTFKISFCPTDNLIDET